MRKDFNVWAMNINPKGGGEGYNKQCAFELCKKENIIGLGWYIKERFKNLNKNKNQKKAEKAIIDKFGEGEERSAMRLIKDMKKNDFVIIYSKTDKTYYTCKVNSECKQGKKIWKKNDIAWYRNVEWKKMDRKLLPGKIIRNPRISTLVKSSIEDYEKEYVKRLFKNKDRIEKLVRSPKIFNRKIKSFEDFSPEEAEDVICNYIQSLGWRMIKSSTGSSNPDYECFFKNSKGQTAYIQVKTGKAEIKKENIELIKKDAKEKNKIYVYTKQDLPELENEKNIEIISEKKLIKYINNNIRELPINLLTRNYLMKEHRRN